MNGSFLQLSASTDLAVAAHRRLSAVSGIAAALSSPASFTPAGVWLFVRELQTVVEGSGAAAAVLREEGSWTRPNSHNTARFPRLYVDIYADCSRDSNQTITKKDAEPRARAVWEYFQTVLHRTDAFAEIWGATSSDSGLRVWGSQLQALPDIYPVSDWEGGVHLSARYGLSVG